MSVNRPKQIRGEGSQAVAYILLPTVYCSLSGTPAARAGECALKSVPSQAHPPDHPLERGRSWSRMYASVPTGDPRTTIPSHETRTPRLTRRDTPPSYRGVNPQGPGMAKAIHFLRLEA